MGHTGPVVFLLFWTFFPQLENNDTSKCSSDSFQRMMPYMLCVENFKWWSSNRGHTVPERKTISCNQNRRVQHI